ncbi:MAG: nicotinamidase [Ignavibacteriaceae bacterium]
MIPASVPPANVEVPELHFTKKMSLQSDETAMIIVDMQNDFVKKNGSLFVPAAAETLNNIGTLLKKARLKKVKVIFTQDTHFDGDKEWDIWPKHCEKNSWGWKIVDELKPSDNELIVEKNRYDGFYQSNLEHYLSHVWKIKNLVITGTVSNICVAHTAASAGLRWFNIVVPADGISSFTDFDQAMTLRQVSTLYTGSITKSVEDINFT